jgi:hypothetical protein
VTVATTANRNLAIDAEIARSAVQVAVDAVQTFQFGIEAKRYELAEATVNSRDYQHHRADVRADLVMLKAIGERLERIKHLLAEEADAPLTFGQAQVRDCLVNIAARESISKDQADDFIDDAVRSFIPRGYERVEVDRVAVDQALFGLTDDSQQRVLRAGVTLDIVRQAVDCAAEVSY